MARNSLFEKGSAVYCCYICGRRTRHTGVQAIGSDLCPECWDLSGLENMVLDGEPLDSKLCNERNHLLAQVTRKKGDKEKVKKQFNSLFPNGNMFERRA